jgi:hypothetical protein
MLTALQKGKKWKIPSNHFHYFQGQVNEQTQLLNNIRETWHIDYITFL